MSQYRRLSRTAVTVLFTLTLVPGCGPKGATVTAKQYLPPAEAVRRLVEENSKLGSEVATWNEWVIVRDRSTESGDMPAYLMRWENGAWKTIASTTEGFWYTADVQPYIPNLTPEGAHSLGLIDTRLPLPEDCRKLIEDNPGCRVSIWNEWAIVSSAVSEKASAHILHWTSGSWNTVASDSTKAGFQTVEQVKPYIPNLTQAGADQLGLTNESGVVLPKGDEDE
ncbi:MAG: hypothetical protein ABIL25_00120 [candidate division WOR-3 bacterium]